jgi:small subunit ribosomal protein S8
MDPISDMTTIIRNGYLARKEKVAAPYSEFKKVLAEKLLNLGFLDSVEVNEKEKKLSMSLRYIDGKPALSNIERMSKPSLRTYARTNKIPRILSGRGEVLLSTSRGLLTGAEAKRAKAGGELLLKVW